MSIYDDPALQSGDFIKFEAVGDKIVGEVLDVSIKTWDDGSKCPQLIIRDDNGDEKTLTAGQVRLKLALVEHRPEPGDRVSITYTENEKRAGGKTLKHFEVKVAKAKGAAKAGPAAAPVEAPAADPFGDDAPPF